MGVDFVGRFDAGVASQLLQGVGVDAAFRGQGQKGVAQQVVVDIALDPRRLRRPGQSLPDAVERFACFAVNAEEAGWSVLQGGQQFPFQPVRGPRDDPVFRALAQDGDGPQVLVDVLGPQLQGLADPQAGVYHEQVDKPICRLDGLVDGGGLPAGERVFRLGLGAFLREERE